MHYSRSVLYSLKLLALCGITLSCLNCPVFSAESEDIFSPLYSASDVEGKNVHLVDDTLTEAAINDAVTIETAAPLIQISTFAPIIGVFSEKVNSFSNPIDLAQILEQTRELMMLLPIPKEEFTPEIERKLTGLIQSFESILLYDRGELLKSRKIQNPHLFEYYMRLETNPAFIQGPGYINNSNYYKKILQIAYTIQKKLAHPGCTAKDLKQQYYIDMRLIEQVYPLVLEDALNVAEDSFQSIIDNLVIDETRKNPYDTDKSAYSVDQQEELSKFLKHRGAILSRLSLGADPINFYEFDNIANGECGFYGLGISFEKAKQAMFGAFDSNQILNKEIYKPLNRVLLSVFGEEYLKGDRLVKYSLGLVNGLMAADPAVAFKNTDFVLDQIQGVHNKVRDGLTAIENRYNLKREEHSNAAPYLPVVGPRPADVAVEADEAEKIKGKESIEKWNLDFVKWQEDNADLFEQWNSLKIKIDDEYGEERFQFLFDNLLHPFKDEPAVFVKFINEEFEKTFVGKFLEIDPEDKANSMVYVHILQRLMNFNLYLWLDKSDPYFQGRIAEFSDENSLISLAKSWKISDTARDIHLKGYGLMTQGSGHYKKLVPSHDIMGLINARRHEEAFCMPKEVAAPVVTVTAVG